MPKKSPHLIKWEKEQAAKKAARKKLQKAMSTEQLASLKNLDSVISDVLQTIYECKDVWMSQVSKLDYARYELNDLITGDTK